MITKPVPALLCASTGHNPTSRTTPELATALASLAGGGGGRKREIAEDKWRPIIPLKTFADWLDFLEATLGTQDAPDGSFLDGLDDLPVDEALPILEAYERDLDGILGMDRAFNLPTRFPWLHTVEDIAGTTERDIRPEDGHGFFHWELHFAHVFRGENGGFDLQVGNPPWVQPRWKEDVVLAEKEPWFKLAEKPSVTTWRARKDALLGAEGTMRYFLGELTGNSGIAEWLGSSVTYPILTGTQPDLYRAFMCRVWGNLGAHGMAGLVHPDTHLGGTKDGRIRAATYPRLRLHAGFVNVGNWAFEASRNTEFGVHIYGTLQEAIRFDNVSRLYGVEPLVASLGHDGEGEVPGMKYAGGWDLRPHRARVIMVDKSILAEWQRLTGEIDVPPTQAALLQSGTSEEQGAIAALSAVSDRVGAHKPWITAGYHEKMGREQGFISWGTSQPKTLAEVIFQGPHLGIAMPISKQPKVPCRGNHDWTSYDLTTLPAHAIPRTNYVRPEACSTKRYEENQDSWPDRARLDPRWRPTAEEWARRGEVLTEEELTLPDDDQLQLLRRRMRFFQPYTLYYRLAWRRMIPFNTERSLFAALIPPGPAHVHTVQSMALADNHATALNAGFWASLPLDYLLRITGRSDLQVAEAKKMPHADPSHPLAGPLLLRTLRLNCLTDAYAPLWVELYHMTWPGYEDWVVKWPRMAPLAGHLKPTWEYGTPLRTEYERRAALVEIDALVAVWLGMSADELVAIHKARYAILADRESRMWFDAKGRQLAQDPYAHGHGQTKEHYEQFLAHEKGERSEPPEGYTAPFYKADREQETRAAHAHFEARLTVAK